MKQEFIKYLDSIAITKPIQERIETIYTFFCEICGNEIKDIFVTDYVKQDGEREYQNLWFFSENNAMEAKNFIKQDDFDITPIKKNLNYLNIQKQDYDFKKSSEKSRLSLKSVFEGGGISGITGDLKASKENCDYLRTIILKYFVRNLKY